MATVNVGIVSPVIKGNWDNTATYDRLNIVHGTDGATYQAIQEVPAGTALSNTTYWMQLTPKAPVIGTVTDVAFDAGASVTNSGTAMAPVLDFDVPRGVTGNESIDDTAGDGDTDVVWSANKSYTEDLAIKNKMDEIADYPNENYFTNPVSGTYNGVTVTFNDDGTITLDGTATAKFGFGLMGSKWGIDGEFYENAFKGETYSNKRTLISGTESSPPTIRYTSSDSSEGTSITQESYVTLTKNVALIFFVASGRIFNNATYSLVIQRKQAVTLSAVDREGRDYSENTKSIQDFLFQSGNNLLPLHDYHAVTNGITIDIKNGILSLNGTSTSAVRVKLSGEYEYADTLKNSWKTETLSQFEIGKTYSLHDIVIAGTKGSTYGVNLRNASSSVISGTKPEATLSGSLSFAMLYIPDGTVIDNVSFIPFFIEGSLEDTPYYRKLNNLIEIEGVKKYANPDFDADFIYNSTLQSAIKFPSTYKTVGEPTPLLILCHGLSSTISASTWGTANMINLVNNFASAGYAVMDVNQVSIQDWVNPALIKKYVTAINYMTEHYNVIPKAIFGESMGSLISLCLAKLYPTVKACAIGGIRLDMASRYAVMTSAQKAIVNANLGFPEGTETYLPNIAAGWDKTAISYFDTNEDKVCANNFPPTFFVVGTDDDGETATKPENLAKISEIQRGGTICKKVEYEGDHTEVCYLIAGTSFDDTIDWYNTWL